MVTRSWSNAIGRGRPAEGTQKRASQACPAHQVKPMRLHCTGEAIGLPCTHSLLACRPDHCPDQAEADAAPHPSKSQHKDRFHRRCQRTEIVQTLLLRLRHRSSDVKPGDTPSPSAGRERQESIALHTLSRGNINGHVAPTRQSPPQASPWLTSLPRQRRSECQKSRDVLDLLFFLNGRDFTFLRLIRDGLHPDQSYV